MGQRSHKRKGWWKSVCSDTTAMYSSTILEALREDADWDNISKKCDHIKLVHKLIKQTSSKYHPYLTIIEELMAIC